MKRAALLVGVNKYEDPEIVPLKCAERDAMELYGFLKLRAGYEDVRCLQGAQASDALDVAVDMVKVLGRGDLFLFYFAGHGVEHANRHLLLLPNARHTRLDYYVGTIPVDLLKRETGRAGATRVMLLDACRSEWLGSRRGSGEGMRGSQGLRDLVGGGEVSVGPMTLVCSCDEGETAQEIEEKGQGLFTSALLEELGEGLERGEEVRVGTDLVRSLTVRMERLAAAAGRASMQRPWIAASGGEAVLVEGRGRVVAEESTAVHPASPVPKGGATRVKCPLCGRRNDPDDTFECRVCKRDYLCQDHFVKGKRCCEECAERAEREEQQRRAEETRKKAEAAVRAEREAKERAEQERRKAEETKPKEWEGPGPGKVARVDLGSGVVLEMVGIPAGEFMMGSPKSEKGRDDDEVPHKVKLTKGFWLGKYAVTQAEYEAVMGENPSHFKGAKRPVECVSWHEAVAFCNALSEREGLRPCYSGSGDNITCNWGANGYRLPTEAEWEYACRAGTRSAFYTGECTEPYGKDPALDRAGWYDENSGSETHEVGQKKPNVWGLYDMHGNAWEWCWDWHGGYPTGGVTDPVGPSSGSDRVFRGGSWGNYAGGCRSANRLRHVPGYRWNSLGFRLARS